MKRRILALVLACLMFVSLVPVSVFADATCPGVTANHTKANCEYTFVQEHKAENVCEDAYKIYQCNECKSLFLDDIVKGEAHTYVEYDTPRVPATCTSDGEENHKKCTKCGNITFDKIVNPGNDLKHNWKDTTTNVGLQKKEQKCEDCGATQIVDNKAACNGTDHTWAGVEPVITKEPTATEEGIAVFTCKDCGATEAIRIHNHDKLVQHKVTEAKDKDCTKDYVIKEYWECTLPNCYGQYFSANVAGMSYTDAVAKKIAADDMDEYVVKAHSHAIKTKVVDGATVPDASYTIVDPAKCLIKFKCNECGKDVEAVQHLEKRTVRTAATCGSYGYKRDYCVVCAYERVYDWENPLVHTSYADAIKNGSGVTVSYKLGKNAYTGALADAVVTCEQALVATWNCKNCNKEMNHTVKAALGHVRQTITVAATCDSPAFSFDICVRYADKDNKKCVDTVIANSIVISNVSYDILDAENLGYTKQYDNVIANSGKILNGGAYDPNNHYWHVVSEVAADCENNGERLLMCRLVHTTKTIVLPKTGHKFDDKAEPKYEVIDGVCSIVRPCINGCGKNAVATVAPIIIEGGYAEANKMHDFDMAADPAATFDGDCTEPAWEKRLCKDCNKLIVIVTEKAKGHVMATGEDFKGEGEKAAVAPTCEKDGTAAKYICTVCNKLVGGETVKKLEHKFEKVAQVNATCTTDGFTEYYVCKNPAGTCELKDSKNDAGATQVDPARKGAKITKYHDVTANFKFTAAKAATCSAAGNKAYYTCPIEGCGATFEKTVVEGKDVYTLKVGEWYVIAKLDHVVTPRTKVEAVCGGTIGYTTYKCVNGCGFEMVTDYVKYVHAKGEIMEGDANKKAPTCTEEGFQNYKCTGKPGCTYVEKIPALGHKNAAGQVLTTKCDSKAVTDRKCATCKAEIKVAEGDAGHDLTNINVAATCTERGYTAKICKLCKETTNLTYVAALGHDEQMVVTVVPSLGAMGKAHVTCSRCDWSEDREIGGLRFSISLDNAKVSDAGYVDSSFVKVTVYVQGLPDVDVRSISFAVYYYADSLEFVSADFFEETNIFTTGTMANAVIDDDKVMVTAMVANNADKEGQDVNIDEKIPVAELTFQIQNKEDNFGGFYVDDTLALNSAGDEVYTIDLFNDFDNDGVEEESEMFWDAYADFEYGMLMDVNGDDDVNLKDLQIVYQMIKGENGLKAYDAAADVNKDGTVDLKDYELLNKYIIGSTEATYAKLTGYTVAGDNPEPPPAKD